MNNANRLVERLLGLNERNWLMTVEMNLDGLEELEPREAGAKIIAMLNAKKHEVEQKIPAGYEEYCHIIDDLLTDAIETNDFDEIDYALNDLYAWGDNHSVWMKGAPKQGTTFPGGVAPSPQQAEYLKTGSISKALKKR